MKNLKYILVGCAAIAAVVVWLSVGDNQPANAENSDFGITIKLSETFLENNLAGILALLGDSGLNVGAATRYPTGYIDTADGYYVDGTAIIDADGNVDGAITSSTGTFSSTLDVTGATTLTSLTASGAVSFTSTTVVDEFTQGGGCWATTTGAGTWGTPNTVSINKNLVLTEANLLAYNCIEFTFNVASTTVDLPASTTMTTLLANVGDMREWIIHNASTTDETGGLTLTIASSTGIELIGVTADDDLIDDGEWARLTCIRETSTDVVCITSELLDVD